MQKALVVVVNLNKKFEVEDRSLNELNELLEQGWVVISSNPMGSGNGAFAFSLVIIEKNS